MAKEVKKQVGEEDAPFVFTLSVDPSKLNDANIKQITDSLIADLAKEATQAASRRMPEPSSTAIKISHSKGHGHSKWGGEA